MKSYSLHLVLITLCVPIASCRSQSPSRLMTYSEYGQSDHVVPYVLDLDFGRARLVYFGSRHTFCPSDWQVEAIQDLWEQTSPTVAFNEGGDPPVAKSREEAVSVYGEAGLVRFLASRDAVAVRSLEPPRATEIAHLCRHFDSRLVKLFYVLRDFDTFRKNHSEDEATSFLEGAVVYHGSFPGLQGPPETAAEFEAEFSRRFPGIDKWRDFPSSIIDPAIHPSESMEINEVAASASRFRDKHMITTIEAALAEGATVFAVVGASHVVVQEPVLRMQARSRLGTTTDLEGVAK